MTTVTGKALLFIYRLDDGPVPFNVYAYVLTGDQRVADDFYLLDSDSLPLPNAAYRLKPGDRITVAVSYEFTYTRGDGWTTDNDIDLHYNRQKVLRRRIHKDNWRGGVLKSMKKR
jgi:hypothetical protein